MDNQLRTYLRNIKSLDPKKREAAVAGLATSDAIEALAALEKTASEDTNIEVQFQAKRALESLRKTLTRAPSTDNSDAAKIKSIKAAAAKNSPKTLPKLIKDLETEESPAVRGTALLAIGLLGGTDQLQLFAHHLGDKDPSVRLNCVKALTYMNEKMAYPLFIVALNDSNAKVASRSYGFVRKLGKENIIGLLNKMASAKQLWMRRAAAKAAGKFSAPEVMSVLRQLASDNKGNIRDCALRSIKAITERQARDQESEKGKDVDIFSGTKSAAENEILRSDKSVGFIISRDNDSPLNSEDIITRMEALQDIMNEADSVRLPEVIARLPVESDNKLKATILIVIGQLGEETDLSHIVPYLRHKDSRIRATAVEVAGTMNPDNIVKLLSPFLDDDDNRTTANAVVALGREPDANIIPALKRLAAATDINHKKSCIYAIAQLEDKRGLEFLKLLAADPAKEVAEQAADAIAMLSKSIKLPETPLENEPTEGSDKSKDKPPPTEKKATVRKRKPLKRKKTQRPSMPSQFDLNQTSYRHSELTAVDVIYPCYFAYASASLIAMVLITLVALTENSQSVFYGQMAIAFIISIEYVAAAVSLQGGKEWSRQFLLFTTKIIRIPVLAPKSANILAHEDTIDLFSSDELPQIIGKIVIAFTITLLIVFLALLIL